MVVGSFGKIPAMGDFLRFRVQGDAATHLEQWVDRGMESAAQRFGAGWKEQFAHGMPVAFCHRAPPSVNASSVVVGVMQPSRDAVGRSYPIAIVSQIPEAAFAGAPHLVPLSVGAFLDQSLDALELAETADRDSYLRRVDLVYPPALESIAAQAGEYDHWIRNTSIADALKLVFKSDASGAEVFDVILQCAASVRAQEPPPPSPLAVRLPLGIAGVGGAAFWVDVVRHACQWRSTIPSMFWIVEEQEGFVTVHFGDSSPSSLSEVWQPTGDDDHVCDLTGALAPATHLPDHVARVLADRRLPVAHLLASLAI